MENKTPIDEVLQRLVRLETRVVHLGDHMGANLRTQRRVEVHPGNPAWAEVDALDVSLSRIISELARAGTEPGCIAITHRGLPVASIYYKTGPHHEPEH